MAHRYSSGFTLLELIIVFSLIGVVATLILPNIRFSFEAPISDTEKILSLQLQKAIELSVTEQKSVRLLFDFKENTLQIQKSRLPSNIRPAPEAQADSPRPDSMLQLFRDFESHLAFRSKNKAEEDNFHPPLSIPARQREALLLGVEEKNWETASASQKGGESLHLLAKVVSFRSSLPENSYNEESQGPQSLSRAAIYIKGRAVSPVTLTLKWKQHLTTFYISEEGYLRLEGTGNNEP